MATAQEEYRRTTPQNELDLAMLTTDAVWGKPEVSPELKKKLGKYSKVQVKDEETGQIQEAYSLESMWGLLSFYTRDMRLANLSPVQLEYCAHYLNLAGDLLQEQLTRPFIIALSRAATVLELSQSKGGFLRKRLTTITSESYKEEKEPPKRNFFGRTKTKGGY